MIRYYKTCQRLGQHSHWIHGCLPLSDASGHVVPVAEGAIIEINDETRAVMVDVLIAYDDENNWPLYRDKSQVDYRIVVDALCRAAAGEGT